MTRIQTIDVTKDYPELPQMNTSEIDKARCLEAAALQMPQVEIVTDHVLHGGMYARTVMIPAGVMITGTLIKVPTLVIFDGDAHIYIGDESIHLSGRHVLPAAQNRKQVFVAVKDTWLTMVFPSAAKNVKDAEDEFTDEGDILLSRQDEKLNRVMVSGDQSCQASAQLQLFQGSQPEPAL